MEHCFRYGFIRRRSGTGFYGQVNGLFLAPAANPPIFRSREIQARPEEDLPEAANPLPDDTFRFYLRSFAG
jgi:hypothetical protein